MCTQPVTRFTRTRGLLLLVLLLCAQGAWAISVSPSPSTTGSYTVRWGTPVGDYIYPFTWCDPYLGCYTWYIPYSYYLQEYNGSSWVTVSGLAQGATSKSYSGKPPAAYQYRIWVTEINCYCGLAPFGLPGVAEGPVTQVVLSPGVSTLPPVFPAVDGNGVDLATGAFTYSQTDVVIGPPGAGGLNLTRTYLSTPFGYWTHNHNGYLVANGLTCSVVLGTFVETFATTQADCQGTITSNQQRGATLSYSYNPPYYYYTYTARDGTVAQFERYTGTIWALNMPEGAALLKKITAPSGEVTDYTYEVSAPVCNPACYTLARLASVDNNFGYRLYFGYPAGIAAEVQPYLVRGSNKAVEYCTTSCSQTWPTVTYTWIGWDLTGATNGNGGTTNYILTWNSSLGYLLTEVQFPDNANHDINLSYAAGRVAGIDLGYGTWGYTYADANDERTTEVTNPGGTKRVAVSYLATGRIKETRNELNQTASFQYDSAARLTRITQPENNYTHYTLDGRGNITQTRRVAKPNSGLADLVTSATYPATCTNTVTCNQPNYTYDARGYRTDYTYFATHGGVDKIKAPAPTGAAPGTTGTRPETRFTYAQKQARYKTSSTAWTNGTPVYRLTATAACSAGTTCAGTATETVAEIAYPSTSTPNNLLPDSTTTRSGNTTGAGAVTATTTLTYTAWGDPLTIDGPLLGTADTTRFYYDAGQRPTGVVGPDPDGTGALKYRAQRTTYNAIDQVTVVERGTVTNQGDTAFTTFALLEQQDMAYDMFGRLTRTRLWNGSTIVALSQFNYDTRGRPQCTALRMNPGIFTSPPADACTLGTEGSFGPDRISRTLYDNASRVSATQSAVGVTGLEQTTAAYTYTANGQVETLTDARSYRTTYVYDGFDRLKKRRYPLPGTVGESSTTDYEEYTYDFKDDDQNGIHYSERRRSGATETFNFSYDNLGRVTLRDAPGTQPDVTYAYDLMNRVTSASQTGNVLTTAYDALSRVTGVTSSVLGTVSYLYDDAGRRTRLTYPGNFYVTYEYHTTGELTGILESGSTALATFGYDDLGRRTSLTRGNDVVTSYNYDAASRLQTLSQDPANTAHDVTFTFAYNPANQLTARTHNNAAFDYSLPASFTKNYTADGLNRYASAPGPTGGSITPTYDARGNLTSDGVKTYAYDYDNRLVIVNGSTPTLGYDPAGRLHQVYSSPSAITRFLYDGADLIAEYNGSGTLQKRYVHGPGLDEPLVWYEGSGTTDRRYLLADERGSVIGVVNNAGTVTVNKYDEYGVPATGNQGRFQYTGQIWLAELGLYHYKARLYDPLWGRFLQTDPIGTAGGMNLYGYAGNDPVNRRDPSGLISNTCWDGSPATSSGGCPPMPAGVGHICYASRINTVEGSGCGGSYYDPSYYSSYYDYLHALEERPRNMRDAFALAEAEGFFRIGPYTIADNEDGPFAEEIESVTDFGRNYMDMREANTIGADRYFHCKANCEAAQRGRSGVEIANTLSNIREYLDQLTGDSLRYSLEDQLANKYGRIRGAVEPNAACSTLCVRFRPPALDPQY